MNEYGKVVRPKPALTCATRSRVLAKAMEPAFAASEIISMILDEDDPEREAGIAQEFDWNTVTRKMADKARRDVLACTRRSLKHRGFPRRFLVFRGGETEELFDIVPVTYDRRVAQGHATKWGHRSGMVQVFGIHRDEVLADVDAFQQFYDERELLVHRDSLTRIIDQYWVEP